MPPMTHTPVVGHLCRDIYYADKSIQTIWKQKLVFPLSQWHNHGSSNHGRSGESAKMKDKEHIFPFLEGTPGQIYYSGTNSWSPRILFSLRCNKNSWKRDLA